MADFAVIKTGGKQYKVKTGDVIKVEKIATDPKEKLEFSDLFEGKKVLASIVDAGKSDKVLVVKFKSKKRYMRVLGHRQEFTKIKIDEIK